MGLALVEECDNENESRIANLKMYTTEGELKWAAYTAYTRDENQIIINAIGHYICYITIISQCEFEQYFRHANLKPSELQLKTHTRGKKPSNWNDFWKYSNHQDALDLHVI